MSEIEKESLFIPAHERLIKPYIHLVDINAISHPDEPLTQLDKNQITPSQQFLMNTGSVVREIVDRKKTTLDELDEDTVAQLAEIVAVAVYQAQKVNLDPSAAKLALQLGYQQPPQK